MKRIDKLNFTNAMQTVDPLVKVEYPPKTSAQCVRVKPSDSKYRNALIKAAKAHRPDTWLVSVVAWVDDWNACVNEWLFYNNNPHLECPIKLSPEVKAFWMSRLLRTDSRQKSFTAKSSRNKQKAPQR